MSEPLKAVWEGEFKVGGVTLKVFVLEDGQRIISADSLAAFLGQAERAGGVGVDDGIHELAAWLKGATPSRGEPR